MPINNITKYQPLVTQLYSKVHSAVSTAYQYAGNHKLSTSSAIATLAAIAIFNYSDPNAPGIFTGLAAPIENLSGHCFTQFCTNTQDLRLALEKGESAAILIAASRSTSTHPTFGVPEHVYKQILQQAYENEAVVVEDADLEDQEILEGISHLSTEELPQALISFFDSLQDLTLFEMPDQGIDLANQACKILIAERNFEHASKLLQNTFDSDPESFRSSALNTRAIELFHSLLNHRDFIKAADTALKFELIKNPYFKANGMGIYEYAPIQRVAPKSIHYSLNQNVGLILVKTALSQPNNTLLESLINQRDLLFYFREILLTAIQSFEEGSDFSQIKRIIQAGYARLFDSHQQSVLTSQVSYQDTDLLDSILDNPKLLKHIAPLNNELKFFEYSIIKGNKASFLNLVKLLPELPENFLTLLSKYQRQKWIPEILKD